MTTITATQATFEPPDAKDQERRRFLLDAAGKDVEVLSPESSKEGDVGKWWPPPRACGPQGLPATCLLAKRGVQTQQGDASLLDRGEVGHGLPAARR